MIAVRLEHFHDRRDEWILSAGLLGFGLILLLPGSSFGPYPSYRLMGLIMPEDAWGALCSLVGLLRVAVLFVNGARRETPVLRQWGACAGMLVWAFLMIGSFGVDVHLPTTMLYVCAFLFEGTSMSSAARDGMIVKRARGSDAAG